MQKSTLLISAIIVLSLSPYARAIDREASMIDTLSIETTQYDSGDSLGVSLWGETVTATRQRNWAILLGGSIGTLWPDRGDGLDYWELGLGMKYYPRRNTSATVRGLYRELDLPDRPDILTAEFFIKHRLIPAEETVSPFVRAGIGSRVIERIPEPDTDEDFSETIFLFGAGCDFMMAENFAIVFESTWYRVEETQDWWLGSIGMQYYWE